MDPTKETAGPTREREPATRASINRSESIRRPTADIIVSDYVREMMSIIRELRQIRAERKAQ
jgi:hypothetical protein